VHSSSPHQKPTDNTRKMTVGESIHHDGAVAAGPARASVGGYGLALLFVTTALIWTSLVQHLFPHPFLFLFFAAVVISAWIGGTGPGLFAVLLSTLVVDYFFIPPLDSFAVKAPDVAYFSAFVLSALAGSWVSSSQRKSREALRAAHDQLELHVAQRTAELQQVNADLRERERQLRMIEHLSRVLTIGELTASIAHEVNQPIAAVVTYGHACLEWLTQTPPNLDEARHAAEQIIKDGSRAGAVIGRIKSLYRKEPSTRELLDVNEVIQDLIVFLRDETARDRIDLRTDFALNLPSVEGDRVQLQQVLQNLVANGIDAMHGSTGRARELWITTAKETSGEVAVRIKDSGVGLSQEVSDRIFQPFFTTKPQGIGLGLSISRSIIESHGGHLSASQNTSGGAVFQFTLPAAALDQHG
jgi:C4-dicarboxylate-specific signal transduction histidine kinase